MPLPFVTADQRLQSTGIKIQIWGPAKIGKTSLLWTLPAETTLALDLEAGMTSVAGWKGVSIPVRTWEDCRNYVAMIAGPNPALRQDQPYSQAHFDYVTAAERLGPASQLDRFENIFIDSTTFSSALCMQWAKGQPEAYSEKTGKPDMRGMYGLIGRELTDWARQLQYAPGKNVFLVGGIVQKEDDIGRKHWAPMIDGSASEKFPYIFDEIITMQELQTDEGNRYRAFVCQKMNPWGYPAGDRSGALDLIEKPHLGELVAKIKAKGSAAARPMEFQLPSETAA